MGVVYAVSQCFGCRRLMHFNPMRVPSISSPFTDTREPICKACVERVNPMRIANGLQPIVPLPDAYQPCNEEDLSYD